MGKTTVRRDHDVNRICEKGKTCHMSHVGMQVVIAATGTKKAATVSAAWDMPLEESERQQMKMLPVMMVDPVDGLVVWLLDLDAASELDVDDEDQDPDVP